MIQPIPMDSVTPHSEAFPIQHEARQDELAKKRVAAVANAGPIDLDESQTLDLDD